MCSPNLPTTTGADAIYTMPPVSSPPYSTPLNIKSEFKPELSPCPVSTMPTFLPPYNMCNSIPMSEPVVSTSRKSQLKPGCQCVLCCLAQRVCGIQEFLFQLVVSSRLVHTRQSVWCSHNWHCWESVMRFQCVLSHFILLPLPAEYWLLRSTTLLHAFHANGPTNQQTRFAR